ncbi:hypothetical protein HOLleu_37346 [Holothuria leucospilota]|uniref:Uncharacterized protein n=1 Tax=Holothuria leucospilota TaxID=206669 RepID=A0A9Q0YGZ5_HOLLE|nr:hypothetical protein HOLleu_37346 [Holothuria leucospilota]
MFYNHLPICLFTKLALTLRRRFRGGSPDCSGSLFRHHLFKTVLKLLDNMWCSF